MDRGIRNPGGILICAVLILGSMAPVSREAWAQSRDSLTGRIEDTAVLGRRLTTEHKRVRVYAEPGTLPAPATETSHPLTHVVVYPEPGPAGGPFPLAPAEVRQHGERFVPHALPIVVGTTVDFPNDDPVYHNVFSLSSTRSFDLVATRVANPSRCCFPSPESTGLLPLARRHERLHPGAQELLLHRA